MPIGVHTSIAGGLYRAVERAAELKCGAVQIFGRNPRSWAFKPVSENDASLFRARRLEARLSPVVIHATYLINLASSDDFIFEKSVELFNKEFHLAEELGADYIVTHLGSPGGAGGDFALRRFTSAFYEAVKEGLGGRTMLLFENSAGGGFQFGRTLDEVGAAVEGAQRAGLRTGLCFDTCHGFAAGYPMNTPADVRALADSIDKKVGLKNLRLIHLNDSKGRLGSRIDRHEHIGKGNIGLEGFKALLNFSAFTALPLILETPKKSKRDDARNLKVVRTLIG